MGKKTEVVLRDAKVVERDGREFIRATDGSCHYLLELDTVPAREAAVDVPTREIDGSPFVLLDFIHEAFGKPAGWAPGEWTTEAPEFWMDLAGRDIERHEAVVEDDRGCWCLRDTALEYVAAMCQEHCEKASDAILGWYADDCDERDDAIVATRMRIHGESDAEARAILRRYC